MRVPALSLCAAHGRDTLYGAPRPGGMLPAGPKNRLAKLPPVCSANTGPAWLARNAAWLRHKREERLVKLPPVCYANTGDASLAKEALGCVPKRRGLAARSKARTAACSRFEPVVGVMERNFGTGEALALAFRVGFLPLRAVQIRKSNPNSNRKSNIHRNDGYNHLRIPAAPQPRTQLN